MKKGKLTSWGIGCFSICVLQRYCVLVFSFYVIINRRSSVPTDLSVSPSPQTQASQWQSSISYTGSRTRTSLGFSAIEKHWKIRSSHRFYGVYASKMEKRCAWGTCNTDSMYPERMGNIIYVITFPESKQNRAKCSSSSSSRFICHIHNHTEYNQQWNALKAWKKWDIWNVPKYSTPIQMKTKTLIFWLSYTH